MKNKKKKEKKRNPYVSSTSGLLVQARQWAKWRRESTRGSMMMRSGPDIGVIGRLTCHDDDKVSISIWNPHKRQHFFWIVPKLLCSFSSSYVRMVMTYAPPPPPLLLGSTHRHCLWWRPPLSRFHLRASRSHFPPEFCFLHLDVELATWLFFVGVW